MAVSSVVPGGSVRTRPTAVTAAVVLAVFCQVATIPFMFTPGADDIPGFAIVIGIVAGLLTLVGSWGLWRLQRWGAILTLVLTGLNVLASIPGYFDPPNGWILAELIMFGPLSVIYMVLIALPSSWRAYRTH
ncbi:MAG: hypothetical protein WBW04_18145 [Nitrolancea sp.]